MNATPNFDLDWKEMKEWVHKHRIHGRKIIFTNGCYDVLHPGHILFLKSIRNECIGKFAALKVIVGLNSDESVRKLKGHPRPIFTYKQRAYMMQALKMVDAVACFNEETPLKIIEEIIPDVLAKGGDYGNVEIVGERFVIQHGGSVIKKYFLDGISSGKVLEKMSKTSYITQT